MGIPYKEDGSALTFKATAAVRENRFLVISGNRTGGPGLSTDLSNVYQMAEAGAGAHAVGVSDKAVANGSLGGTYSRPGMVVPVTSGAAIAAGQAVQSDAEGRAIPLAAGVKLGVCMNGVGAANADAEIRLSL